MTSSRRLFLKQLGMGALGIGLISGLPGYAFKGTKPGLPRSTPEAQGISSADMKIFFDEIAKSKINFHSVMVVRHGHVVVEGWWAPFAPSLKHTLYSLSKSFTSTAVGLAIAEGRFTTETPVISFFPDDLPKEVSPYLSSMKVKHLLTMSTGHTKDTMPGRTDPQQSNWVKAFLEQPIEYEPGTHFWYNTGASYMLSAIVQKTTGQNLIQYLRPRLFDPLGIKGEDWEEDPRGINTGGYGLRIKTEDIARFGQLYLQKGKWEGKQIIPAAWVAEATTSQIDSSPQVIRRPKAEDDWSQGYGYQFWRCRVGGYRADGAFGQFSLVLPDQDAVVAITGESFDMQASMNLVWNFLLPAMKGSKLAENSTAYRELQTQLKSLSMSPALGDAVSPTAAKISGKEFILDDNDFKAKSLSLKFADNVCSFTVKDDRGQHMILCGINQWKEQESDKLGVLFPVPSRTHMPGRFVASASWSDGNTLTIERRFIEAIHGDRLTCVFDDNKITLKFLSSMAIGNPTANPEKRREIQGHTMV